MGKVLRKGQQSRENVKEKARKLLRKDRESVNEREKC